MRRVMMALALAFAPPAVATPLAEAVAAGDMAAARAALAAHADPNQRIDYGAVPLALAVNTQNEAMVALLLAHGARPALTDADGLAPLALACELGGRGIIDRLLAARANVLARMPDGATTLAICARFAPDGVAGRMLAMGAAADANTPDSRGQTPLMWAAASGRMAAMRALLAAHADVNAVSKGGFTPLFFAIASGVPGAAQLLMAAGADLRHRGPENTSAAQLAAYQRNWPALRRLVEAGAADLAEPDREGRRLLHEAAMGEDADLLRLLVARGADANALTGPSTITWVTEANFGVAPAPVPPMTPLLLAAGAGREQAMRALVALGADPHFVAANGVNVVLAAAGGGDAGALAYALDIGGAGSANAADAKGTTALHMLAGGAWFAQLPAMLRVLAAHGARPDTPDAKGRTPAQLADGGITAVREAFRAAFPPPA